MNKMSLQASLNKDQHEDLVRTVVDDARWKYLAPLRLSGQACYLNISPLQEFASCGSSISSDPCVCANWFLVPLARMKDEANGEF